MEFKSLTNIETSFRQIRLYAFIFAIVCVAVSGYAVYASYSFAKEQREKIYVLDQGKSLMLALSQDASKNRPVEAREHVRRFHELFFTIAPDKEPSRRTWSVPSCSAISRLSIITRTWRKRVITTVPFRAMSISVSRWTLSAATLRSIPTR